MKTSMEANFNARLLELEKKQQENLTKISVKIYFLKKFKI